MTETKPLSLADRQRIYRILADEFEFGRAVPMATVAFALTEAGVDKADWGHKKLKAFLAEMGDFLSFTDIIAGGVPQRLVTINKREDWAVERRPVDQTSSGMGEASGLAPAEAHAGDGEGDALALARRMAQTRDYVDAPVPQGIAEELKSQFSSFVYTPSQTLDILRANAPQGLDLRALLDEDWSCALEAGALRYYEGKVIFPLHVLRADGATPIEISIRHVSFPNDEGKPWYMCYVNTYVRPAKPLQRRLIPSRELELFAWLGPWEQFLDRLAELALPEPWDFGAAGVGRAGAEGRGKSILRSYISTTFYRLKLEDKVCIDDSGSFAAFNTGLVDRCYDDIYACFEPKDGGSPAWKFVGFCTGGTGALGKRLVSVFSPLPEPASYFERKEDLLFDLEKELITDFDHVIVDNIGRLPLDFLEEEMGGVPGARGLFGRLRAEGEDAAARAGCFKELGALVRGDARLFRRLRYCLEDAIRVACKRVRWNFKTAIPCYYPRANTMSLLLPLCIMQDDVADVALVVELMPSGNYQGQTILTMRQAYMNARLICRPDSEWLTTEDCDLAGGDEDEE